MNSNNEEERDQPLISVWIKVPPLLPLIAIFDLSTQKNQEEETADWLYSKEESLH